LNDNNNSYTKCSETVEIKTLAPPTFINAKNITNIPAFNTALRNVIQNY